MKRNELSPIQLGEGISTLRQGFIQEGLCPSLHQRKYHSSSACVMYFVFCHVQMKCMCKFVYATDRLEGTSVSYGQNCCAPHLLCERRHFFPFHNSSLFLILPHISPGLPSSHPNQRTHRPLLGTPCPGNPPCTAGYLEHNIHRL